MSLAWELKPGETPSVPVYASRVEESGDVFHRGPIYRNEYLTSSTLKAEKAHYVHDETLNEVYQTYSIQKNSDRTGTLEGIINLGVKDALDMTKSGENKRRRDPDRERRRSREAPSRRAEVQTRIPPVYTLKRISNSGSL